MFVFLWESGEERLNYVNERFEQDLVSLLLASLVHFLNFKSVSLKKLTSGAAAELCCSIIMQH